MISRSAPEIWEAALGQLQLEISKANYRTWLSKTIGLDCRDNQFVIGVPNTFVAEYLEKNQRSLIEKALTGILREDIKVEFRVATSAEKPGLTRANLPLFNPRYTFDTFVVGNSNNLAYAAAAKVVENPGLAFNPLFLYGGAGLGKTHLLHAIGNKAAINHLAVLYVSAEQYTNELVAAIREKSTDEFRKKFRNVDMLLIDDVQFFAGKEQTEENFFYTFNDLHSNNHQIVVASDQPPKSIPLMKERLRSRFEWGLVADIQAPDFETRLGILRNKAQRDGTDINHDVLEFIALQIKENIRALEGSLNRVVAYSKLLKTMITPDIAARALEDIAGKEPKLATITPNLITETVAGTFRLTLSDLRGRRRDEATVLARQVCMYLMRQETECSLSEIGRELGDRSPATISYAYEKMSNAINNDPHLKRQVFNIQQKLYTARAGNS
ncbi:MAG: chromosomal replication initiator protein DnaA [Dehalococcoidales bacterium]|nr:chromosomal replication initiator protein DnaA [Dehalococcoidales bacterium]